MQRFVLVGLAWALGAAAYDSNPTSTNAALLPIEWMGRYAFTADKLPTEWLFSKLEGVDTYPDATMLVYGVKLESASDDALAAALATAANQFENAFCTAVTLDVSEVGCAIVTFNSDSDTTTLPVSGAVAGDYAFFTQHRPEEFAAESIGTIAPTFSEVVGNGHAHSHAHAVNGTNTSHTHTHDDDDAGHTHDDDAGMHSHDDDGATHSHDGDGATHADDDDDGAHVHGATVHPYEWSGAYFLPAGAHTWALKKVNGASSYPDAAMKVYFTALTYDHAENADHTHTTAEVINALTAAEVEATAIFTSETSSEKASGSSMRPTAVLNNIIFDNANEVTTIMLVVDSGSGGYYGIFTEHQPWEFDAASITVAGATTGTTAEHDFSAEHVGHTHVPPADTTVKPADITMKPADNNASSGGAARGCWSVASMIGGFAALLGAVAGAIN